MCWCQVRDKLCGGVQDLIWINLLVVWFTCTYDVPVVVAGAGTRGQPIVFTTIIEPPFVSTRDGYAVQDERVLVGFVPDLVRRVAARLKLPYRLRLARNGAYGVPQGDGTWNGMIGDVMSGEADVAAGALTVLPSRGQVVHFTTPFMETGIAAVYHRPPVGATVQNYLLTSPLDLANRSDVAYGMIPGSLTYNYFRAMAIENATLDRMWRRISSDPNAFEWGSGAGVARVRSEEGRYVFLLESSFAEFLVRQRPCGELLVTRELINPRQYALATRRDFHLARRLSRIIEQLKSNGFIDKLKNKWWKGDCPAANTTAGFFLGAGTVPPPTGETARDAQRKRAGGAASGSDSESFYRNISRETPTRPQGADAHAPKPDRTSGEGAIGQQHSHANGGGGCCGGAHTSATVGGAVLLCSVLRAVFL